MAQATEDDFILTLNNDLEVNTDYLEELAKVYDNQKPCLVGSVSVNIREPEKIESINWNRITGKSRPVIRQKYSYSQLRDKFEFLFTDLLPVRGILIPVEVFHMIGLFDHTHFPQYLADFDFSRRALNQGYKLVASTKAVVKSIVESSGLKYKDNLAFRVFFKSLFSIKSPTWYKIRYYWAIKHSPWSFWLF